MTCPHYYSGTFGIYGDTVSSDSGSALLANDTEYRFSYTWDDDGTHFYNQAIGIQSVPSFPLNNAGTNAIGWNGGAPGGGALPPGVPLPLTFTGTFTTPDSAHFDATTPVSMMTTTSQTPHGNDLHGELSFWIDPVDATCDEDTVIGCTCGGTSGLLVHVAGDVGAGSITVFGGGSMGRRPSPGEFNTASGRELVTFSWTADEATAGFTVGLPYGYPGSTRSRDPSSKLVRWTVPPWAAGSRVYRFLPSLASLEFMSGFWFDHDAFQYEG